MKRVGCCGLLKITAAAHIIAILVGMRSFETLVIKAKLVFTGPYVAGFDVLLCTAFFTLTTIITFFVNIWFFINTKHCFDYLKEIETHFRTIDHLIKKNLERMNELREILIEENVFTPAGTITRHSTIKSKKAKKRSSTMGKDCCCGACSAATGAEIIATFIIVFAVSSVVSVVVIPAARDDTGALTVVSVIQIVASILVFIACKKIYPQMMIPMLILSVSVFLFTRIEITYLIIVQIVGIVSTIVGFISVLVVSIHGKILSLAY
ncbi:hypothetical protein PRIPAC_79940 [Pristionchus pacificus]|uniref:Uncharacterized protein n=1 Tax=Pristionchus pacificus TaxID=54126 RepID=A0A2A6C2S4_PRIPA|nr:hypothetical protein PRIPAC_79940 [Pristionchus pacificus]|eukprot:PDM72446.1 hypothetical protein PRIPAC_38880 [Pristionchus pacificus]